MENIKNNNTFKKKQVVVLPESEESINKEIFQKISQILSESKIKSLKISNAEKYDLRSLIGPLVSFFLGEKVDDDSRLKIDEIIPKPLKMKIISALLKKDVQYFLKHIDKMGKIPSESHREIINSLRYGVSYKSSLDNLVKAFGAISDDFVVDWFARYHPEVIFQNTASFSQISESKLIDLCILYKHTPSLFGHINNINKKYWKKILDNAVFAEAKDFELLNNFKDINVAESYKKIFEHNELQIMVEGLEYLPKLWCEKIPEDILGKMAEKYPKKLTKYLINKIDKDVILHLTIKRVKEEDIDFFAKYYKVDEELSKKIVQYAGVDYVLEKGWQFRKFPKIFKYLLEANPKKAACKLSIFKDLTINDFEKALGYLERENEYDFISSWKEKKFALDRKLVEMLIKKSFFRSLCSNINYFLDVNINEVGEEVINSGGVADILYSLDKFPNLDHRKIVGIAIRDGKFKDLISHLNNLKGVNYEDIIAQSSRAGEWRAIIDNFKSLSGKINFDRSVCEEVYKKGVENINTTQNLDRLVEMSEYFNPPLDKEILFCNELFDTYLTVDLYKFVRRLKDGELSEQELLTFGLTKMGEAGMSQLRERILKFKAEVLTQDFDEKILEKNEFFAQYLKSYVRFDSSEFGNYMDDDGYPNKVNSFEEVVREFTWLKEHGEYVPVGDKYVSSGEVKINKVNKDAQQKFKYSEQFLLRYETIKNSILESGYLLQEKAPLSFLVEGLEEKRSEVISDLQIKINSTVNPKALENLRIKLDFLNSLNLRDIRQFEKNFVKMAEIKEFLESLRQILFFMALHKHRNHRDKISDILQKDKPSFEDVGVVVNFVEHIVNEETWKKYFKDKNSKKALDSLINISALKEEYFRAQNQENIGTTSFDFIPTRGLLMEFSGHIADACWNEKYDSISAQFPNFSAVIMVQHRGTKYERLAGACILIETKGRDGTPLLVIRGLNPLENVINSLSVSDFFDKTISYFRKIADGLDRKLAIVIDDHSGGASTNRPNLYNYLDEKSKNLKKISLVGNWDTPGGGSDFNGYNVTDDTYLV
ncbi:MAG: hypothetical protein WCO84_01725 [bacterium]